MMNVLMWLMAHWSQICEFLVVVGLPSLVNASIKHEKWNGFFRLLLEWMSALAPPDRQGTLKLPFTQSKPLNGVPEKDHGPIFPPPMPGAGFVLVLAVALFSTSCCYINNTCRKETNACMKDGFVSQIPSLLPIVAQAFLHGGFDADVKASLAALGYSISDDEIHCLVKALFNKFDSKLMAMKSGRAMAAPEPWINSMSPEQLQMVRDDAWLWLARRSK